MWFRSCRARFICVICTFVLFSGCSKLTIISSASPAKITDIAFFLSGLSTSVNHICRINKSNKVVCWGRGAKGQLGISSTPDLSKPSTILNDHEFKVVSAGYEHTCAIDVDNNAYCFGDNANGQLGTGDTANKTQPTLVSGARKFKYITAGSRHTCAIDMEDNAYCFGDNTNGQLGTGGTTNALSPTQVAGGHKFQYISAGDVHTCGIDLNNDAWCWGNNANGQLATGDMTDELAPSMLPATHKFKFISAGRRHTCGVDLGSVAWCWGSNDASQLGIGTQDRHYKYRPTPVDGNHKFEYVVAGSHHSCGIESDGTLLCWGDNSFGQLGSEKTAANIPTPTAISASIKFKSVSLQARRTCGVDISDEVYCFGYDEQSKVSSNFINTAPVQFLTTPVAKSLAVGDNYMCMIDESNYVYCWGENEFGQLGVGDLSNRTDPAHVTSINYGLKSIVAGNNFTCGLDFMDSVFCWGDNRRGQLGIANNDPMTEPPSFSNVPVEVLQEDLSRFQFSSITAADNYVCGIDLNDGVLCWGMSFYYLVHERDESLSLYPPYFKPIPLYSLQQSSAYISAIVASNEILCVIDTLYGRIAHCLGDNTFGQFGNGSKARLSTNPDAMTYSDVPHDRQSSLPYSFAIGRMHTCGLYTDNKAFCVGNNGYGQLGAGNDRAESLSLVDVAGDHTFKSIHTDSNSNFTCAIDTSDKAWCWGEGYDGQLGNNQTVNSKVPVAVEGSHTFTSIVTKNNSAYAINTDGEIWHWGKVRRFGSASSKAYLPVHIGTN